jgi:hypothetical protein
MNGLISAVGLSLYQRVGLLQEIDIMILSINMRNEHLVCLDTETIRTVSIVNTCVVITTNLGFCIDDLKIYTDSIDESQQIYDRIVYCISKPMSALNSAKDYLAIGCKDMEEDSDDKE